MLPAPCVDEDNGGRRKRLAADLDALASKTGKHSGGASVAVVACFMSRGQASTDTSVSAGHLRKRGLDTTKRQGEKVDTAREIIMAEADSELANVQ